MKTTLSTNIWDHIDEIDLKYREQREKLKHEKIFMWHQVPGKGNEKIIKYFDGNPETDTIITEKVDGGNKLDISYKNDSYTVTLNDGKSRAILEKNGNSIDEFIVETKNEKLEIHQQKRKKTFDYFYRHIYEGIDAKFHELINKCNNYHQNLINEYNKQISDKIENVWDVTKITVNQSFDREISSFASERDRKIKEIGTKCLDCKSNYVNKKAKISKNEYLYVAGLVALVSLRFFDDVVMFIIASGFIVALFYGRYYYNKRIKGLTLIEDDKKQKVQNEYGSKIKQLNSKKNLILGELNIAYSMCVGSRNGSFTDKLDEISSEIKSSKLDDICVGLESTLSGKIGDLKVTTEKHLTEKRDKIEQLESAKKKKEENLRSDCKLVISQKPEIVSDEKIDQWFEEDTKFASKEALKHLFEADVEQEWLFKSMGLLQANTPLKTKDNLTVVTPGKDDYKIRYPVHYFTYYFTSKSKMAVFSCFFDIIKKKMSGIYSDEFFYSDVVSVSERTVDRIINLNGKKMEILDVPQLTLTVSSGDSMSISFEEGMKRTMMETMNNGDNIDKIIEEDEKECKAAVEHKNDFIKASRSSIRDYKTIVEKS
ncbi:hypothetical protein KA005_69340 [bacterium]|nr:hypothetical protein [bacterium]